MQTPAVLGWCAEPNWAKTVFLKKKLKTIRAKCPPAPCLFKHCSTGDCHYYFFTYSTCGTSDKIVVLFYSETLNVSQKQFLPRSDTSSSWSYLFFKDVLKARQSWEGNPLVTVSSIIHAKQPAAVERLLCNDVIMMHFNEELITSAPKSHCLRSHRCCWMRPGGLLSKLPSQFLGGDCLTAQCIDYLFWGSIQSVSFNALFVWKRQKSVYKNLWTI